MEEEEYLIEELRKIEIRRKEREKKQQVCFILRQTMRESVCCQLIDKSNFSAPPFGACH